mmetsp:Transcript_10510/g.27522  ORF Transcript_10510/g.27522 Transcript_10510/m.27522 type:complete len:123 (-) Transcript_10510:299-667(-)
MSTSVFYLHAVSVLNRTACPAFLRLCGSFSSRTPHSLHSHSYPKWAARLVDVAAGLTCSPIWTVPTSHAYLLYLAFGFFVPFCYFSSLLSANYHRELKGGKEEEAWIAIGTREVITVFAVNV